MIVYSYRTSAAILGACLLAGGGQALASPASDIYQKSVPSVMVLTVHTKAGDTGIGTGFVALREGYAVTAYHVISDAKSVTAKFEDGETFEVTGLVDKDESRDLALVRIKEFGRPILPLAKTVPEIGAKAYVIGSPEALEFTVSDGIVSQIRQVEGAKLYQFSAPASHGNSGGPLLNEAGNVIGIVSFQFTEGQNLNFAVPSTYALALDTTLPTIPWSAVRPPDTKIAEKTDPQTARPSGADNLAGITASDDLPTALGKTITDALDTAVLIDILRRSTTVEGSYKAGVSSSIYTVQSNIRDNHKILDGMKSSDADLERIRKTVLGWMQHQDDALDYYAKSVVQAQTDSGWTPTSNDMLTRLDSAVESSPALTTDDYAYLIKVDTFVAAAPVVAAVLNDSTNFDLGYTYMTMDTLHVYVVTEGSFAANAGLQFNDKIEAIDGHKIYDIFEAKRFLSEDAGKQATITVSRDGKDKILKVKVPNAPKPAATE